MGPNFALLLEQTQNLLLLVSEILKFLTAHTSFLERYQAKTQVKTKSIDIVHLSSWPGLQKY